MNLEWLLLAHCMTYYNLAIKENCGKIALINQLSYSGPPTNRIILKL